MAFGLGGASCTCVVTVDAESVSPAVVVLVVAGSGSGTTWLLVVLLSLGFVGRVVASSAGGQQAATFNVAGLEMGLHGSPSASCDGRLAPVGDSDCENSTLFDYLEGFTLGGSVGNDVSSGRSKA